MKKIVIINRGFWPDSDVPGESLLNLSEKITEGYKSHVITQSNCNYDELRKKTKRAKSVNVYNCKIFTDSRSGVVLRVIESLYFALYVLWSLLRIRPNYIYVATDPPIIVPFIVAIYCSITQSKFTYHMQDIHPEATALVVSIPTILKKILCKIDSYSVKQAYSVVTLTPAMKEHIRTHRHRNDVLLIDNATIYPTNDVLNTKGTIVFSGNAGRLQEIPLLVKSIDSYIRRGGKIKFSFMGSGIYENLIVELANRHQQIEFLGYVPSKKATEIISQHEWGGVSITSEVLNYAFPSKTSVYSAANCKIFAICNENTFLADWVKNGRGIAVKPDKESIINAFFKIEKKKYLTKNTTDYTFSLFSSKMLNAIVKAAVD